MKTRFFWCVVVVALAVPGLLSAQPGPFYPVDIEDIDTTPGPEYPVMDDPEVLRQ